MFGCGIYVIVFKKELKVFDKLYAHMLFSIPWITGRTDRCLSLENKRKVDYINFYGRVNMMLSGAVWRNISSA